MINDKNVTVTIESDVYPLTSKYPAYVAFPEVILYDVTLSYNGEEFSMGDSKGYADCVHTIPDGQYTNVTITFTDDQNNQTIKTSSFLTVQGEYLMFGPPV